MFWYYFEANQNKPYIHLEVLSPCGVINEDENNGFLFKVLYYKRRIAVECFHALTDGYGAMEFLKALIFAYLKHNYPHIKHENMIKVPEESIQEEELEDSFKAYYKSDTKVNGRPKEVCACHISATPRRKKWASK